SAEGGFIRRINPWGGELHLNWEHDNNYRLEHHLLTKDMGLVQILKAEIIELPKPENYLML
ncbi:MAG: hypothetical protein AABX65_04075, partial [Nanoarchaeota archaeon]